MARQAQRSVAAREQSRGRGGWHGLAALVLVLAGVLAARVRAYVRLGATAPDGNDRRPVQWHGPIQYYISNVGVPGVAASDLAAAVGAAFKTWGVVELACRSARSLPDSPTPRPSRATG